MRSVACVAPERRTAVTHRFIHPKTPSKALRIPISSPRDISTDLFLKVVVGQRNAATYHVFEFLVQQSLVASALTAAVGISQVAIIALFSRRLPRNHGLHASALAKTGRDTARLRGTPD